MAFSAKYGFEDLAYSTADKSGIVTSNVGKMDDHLHTYIEGTCGETIAQYDAVYLESDGKYDKAQADGSQQPCSGLAIEAGILDDTIRIQRIGPITDATWTWATVGAKVYLDPSTPGDVTDTKPTTHAQMIGVVLSATSIFITGLIHIDDASATVRGVVELATDAETVTGADTERATTPANIMAKMAAPGEIGGTTPNGITLTNEGLHILDTNASHDLVIKPGSDLTADKILNITTGDAARTVTLNGDPTLDDWFDQAVKVASTPTFGGIIVADGGTIGQAAGPLVNFDDTNNYLEITGCMVGIEESAPSERLVVQGNAIFSGGANIGDKINAPVAGGLRFARNGANEPFLVLENDGGNNALAQIRGLNGGGLRITNGDETTTWMHITNTGEVGLGISSPDRRLHVEKSSALTNTVQQAARFSHITSGAPANNIGVGLEFEQETAADNNEVIATIEAIATDVTPASEEGALSLKTMVAGAAATEALRVDSNVTAAETRLLIYDVDNGTVERVSVGVADSGGAGFKLLRIPN